MYSLLIIVLLAVGSVSEQQTANVTEQECYDFINQWLRENHEVKVFCLDYKLSCTEHLFMPLQCSDFFTPSDSAYIFGQMEKLIVAHWDSSKIRYKRTTNDEELKKLFPGKDPDDWGRFEKKFHAHQYHRCSQPFFNKDTTKCLIYVENDCGGLCGGGDWLLMEYKDKKWIEKESFRCWVS